MKVYLSGPITGLEFDDHLCNGWRELATALIEGGNRPDGLGWNPGTGIRCYSPLRGKVFLRNLESPIDGEYEGPLTNRHAITMRDRHDCLTCDAMLVYLKGAKEISKGTLIELGWADAVRKPIVTVMEPGNIHAHVIGDSLPVAIVDSLEAGCDVIKSILLP